MLIIKQMLSDEKLRRVCSIFLQRSALFISFAILLPLTHRLSNLM